ncbi:TetR/AcrR family transcriptional regulator [Cryptosporangium phraense]|uniref:TetR family transcriptional regulator n=1 Tax=Cryptosporangium phraense TaxID=2593070 RepID=A0A545AUM0_9ACTN|nr:TetR family transcriptional regulator [Cryptosporangium phraense]TQS44295.1 TetR family transcriptional regulator [Cryptosporangium phraense]
MRVNEDRQTPAALARRAQIIDSAIVAIAELGYARASFGRIAEHAGISSTRLISYHFDDKHELMRAVAQAVLARAAEYMVPRIEAADGRREALAEYIRANLAFIEEHPAHIRALIEIASNARTDDGTPLLAAEGEDPAVLLLAAEFRAGQQAGEFRTFDPLVMARTVRAAIDASAGRAENAPAYADELVTLFDLATRPRPEES